MSVGGLMYGFFDSLKIYKIIGNTCNLKRNRMLFVHAVRHSCFIHRLFAELFPKIL